MHCHWKTVAGCLSKALEAVTAGWAMCSAGPAAALLPGANDALQSIAGRPRFLDPEATRPLAAPIHRGRGAAPISPQPDGNEEADGGKRYSIMISMQCQPS